MSVTLIEDIQRLDELTEWCRNKPDGAAVRIMHSEGLAENLAGDRKKDSEPHKVFGSILERTWSLSEPTYFLPQPTKYKFEVGSLLGFRILEESIVNQTPVRITDGTFDHLVMITGHCYFGVFEAEQVRLAK